MQFLGTTELPSIRHVNGNTNSPHLRCCQQLKLCERAWSVKVYPDISQKLTEPRAANVDFILFREATQEIFQHAHGSVLDITSIDRANSIAEILSDLIMLYQVADDQGLLDCAATSHLA